MARCIQSVKALTEFDHLDEVGRKAGQEAFEKFIRDAAYISSYFSGEEDRITGNRVISAVGNKYVNRLLAKISGLSDAEVKEAMSNGKNMWDEVLNATPESRKSTIAAIEKHLAEIYRSIDNPDEVLQHSLESCRTKSLLSQLALQEKVSNKPAALSRKFMQLLGGKSPLWENKINAMQHYPPARLLYRMMHEIDTYTEQHGKQYIAEIHDVVGKTANLEIFKQYNISAAEIGRMMAFFDGNKSAKDPDAYRQFFKWADSNGILTDLDLDPDVGRSMYRELVGVADNWWRINYGDAKLAVQNDVVNKQENGRWTHSQGIVGYMNDLRNKFMEMYGVYRSTIQQAGEEEDPVIRQIVDKLANHKFRNLYISMSRDEEFVGAVKDIEYKPGVNIPDWLGHSRDVDDDNATIDFLKNIDDNILETNMLFNKMSNYLTAKTLRAQLDVEDKKGGGWFSTAGRDDIRVSVESLIDDLNMKADYVSTTQSTATRVVKSIGNGLQTFIASYLMFPGSALNNLLGGSVSIKLRVGNDAHRVEYNNALSNTDDKFHHIAQMVNEYADKWLVSAGLPKEFINANKDLSQGDFIDKINEEVGKAGDFFSKGLFGKFSESWGKFGSLDGTEKLLRNIIKPYLFNQMVATYTVASTNKVLPTGNDLTQWSERVLNDNIDHAWYEITGALGLFSGINKSFYLHTLNDTATNTAQATAGMLLKVWNSFRQVAVAGFDNYVKSGIDIGYNIKREGIAAAIRERGVMASGAVLVSVLSMVMALLKDKKDIMFSPLQSIGPLNEPLAGVKMLGVQAACLLGANVSDENYKTAMEDGVNFWAGALAGRHISDRMFSETAGMLSAANNPIRTTWDVLVNSEIAGYAGKNSKTTGLYEARQKLRDSWGFLLSSDPLFLGERLIEIGFINSDGIDPTADKNIRVNTMKSALSSILGLSLYSQPDFERKRWRQYGRDVDFDRYRTYYKRGNKPYLKHFYSNDVTDRIDRTAFDYGYVPKMIRPKM